MQAWYANKDAICMQVWSFQKIFGRFSMLSRTHQLSFLLTPQIVPETTGYYLRGNKQNTVTRNNKFVQFIKVYCILYTAYLCTCMRHIYLSICLSLFLSLPINIYSIILFFKMSVMTVSAGVKCLQLLAKLCIWTQQISCMHLRLPLFSSILPMF